MVGHSAKTIHLALNSGLQLEYFGELCGVHWPTQGSQDKQVMMGKAVAEAKARLDGLIRRGGYEYFIVTNLAELRNQPALEQLLEEGYPALAKERYYRIYDLRNPLKP